jgi:hypothetical protein
MELQSVFYVEAKNHLVKLTVINKAKTERTQSKLTKNRKAVPRQSYRSVTEFWDQRLKQRFKRVKTGNWRHILVIGLYVLHMC